MDNYYPQNYNEYGDWRQNSPPSWQQTDLGNQYEGGLRSDSFKVDVSGSDYNPSRREPESSGRQYADFEGSRSRDTRRSRSPRQDRYSSKSNDAWSEDGHSQPREYGYSDDVPDRKSQRSRDRHSDNRDRNRDDRSRDRDRKSHQDDYGSADDRDHRSRRRSRSRDRDHDRRRRDTDRDRRHRDSGRDRHRRERGKERGDRERSPKEIPWVPPPLPEHLRHLQVQAALNPGEQNEPQLTPWVPPQPQLPPVPVIQNQFQNDGSFMERFRRMQETSKALMQAVAEKKEAAAASAPAVSEDVSAPPAGPTLPATSSGMPVIAKRRISKILKTGVVQKPKKKEEEEEEEVSEGKKDGWSSYMKEVQRYRANKCIENEASRPPLVK